MMNWLDYIGVGYLLALVIPFLSTVLSRRVGLLVAAWLLAGFYWLLSSPQVIHVKWASLFEIDLHFYLDGLAKVFVAVILLVGAGVFTFASEYLKGSDRIGRFFQALTLFIFSMLGLVTADNFFMAFIFWELTSFTSYLLIGYSHEQEKSRKSALQALLVTGSGGLALLAGLLILNHVTGATLFSELMYVGFLSGNLVSWAVGLILLGGLTKSAQFPFHFWLPNAMAAPAPVSALLHSATMVKAGIFLFLRLDPAFNHHPLWSGTLIACGAFTLLLGAWAAFRHTDLKKMLAYTTVATLGALTFLVGLTHPMAAQVALLLFVAHALYKATLFMVAGTLEHKAGTRNVLELGGLKKQMPLVFAAGGLAALSMIGLPPLLGFLAKEVMLKVGAYSLWTLPIWVAGFALMGTVAWQSGVKPFLGKVTHELKVKPSFLIAIGPLVTAIVGLVLSFDPFGVLSALMSQALFPGQELVPLHLWAGVNLPLVLSIIIVVLAFVGLKVQPKFLKSAAQAEVKPVADKLFDSTLKGVLQFADGLTRVTQNGSLSRYLTLTFAGLLIGAPYVLMRLGFNFESFEVATAPQLPHIVLGLIVLTCTIMAAISHRRLTVIVCMGGIGFSIAAFFALLGAPDLSLTQIIVETLSVILFVFLLHEVPMLRSERSFKNQSVTLAISVGMGVVVSLFTWKALVDQSHSAISQYFGQNSYLMANGKNVVNVILVDFRAFDTLGEITVLAVAALSIMALLAWPVKGKKL